MRVLVVGSSSPRGRLAVAWLYLAASAPAGNWIGGIPGVKASLGASGAGWGMTNSLGTVGELVGFVVIEVVVRRLSTRRIAAVSALLVVGLRRCWLPSPASLPWSCRCWCG